MKSFFLGLLSVGSVAAHGYVSTADIDGKEYQLYQPYQDPYMNPAPQRISRPVQGNGPVQDITLSDIQCGGWAEGGKDTAGSKPAPLHADATAGSSVTLHWTKWPESHVGPVITYLARCPDSGCNDWMPGNDAVWFKVAEAGREGTSNNWADAPLRADNSPGATFKIPQCIKPGYYIIRHELIALHAAWEYPGAQFYPNCIQIKVKGSGNTTPSDLVSFPGAYKPTDPGITYDAYKATPYTIPGPKLFTC
ncbi:glycoside hydrolase family 61 protein-like protein [Eremomyces bilateralis CBS 781.70]|uniref:lytic cellulose monooxygenase (C4-dehydrogenating) n=1 Tax=Eremomyces bilateralis CBS 781.70 TaxID=1392243 RepID=A0A6G1FRF4_9PEZI|nr:glycoside hydrolase family 61 protein-like protein [Eremomyces bilateralis CBS 781.70]KAF1808306.1 glycoside hydrolase family 61 protein-like protein [Eremomyces bilateralis CBS 781.70]